MAPRSLASPDAVRAMVHGEIARWRRVVETARIEQQ
jgi:hypothetical protein